MGNRVKTLEKEVLELSRVELTTFREWFVKFDADEWDRQIKSDIEAGKLDKLAAKALSGHNGGRAGNFEARCFSGFLGPVLMLSPMLYRSRLAETRHF